MGDALIQGGYILLSRKLIESEIMKKPPLYLKVWIWLLLRAQHDRYNGLEKGQIKTSVSEIQEGMTYYVGYRKQAPTTKEIYKILEWLRSPREGDNGGETKGSMIGTTKGKGAMLVTIENYWFYQDYKNYERDNEGDNESLTKEIRKEVKRKTSYKQEIKNKEINIYAEQFQNFKDLYPLKLTAPTKLAQLERSWNKLVQKVKPELVLQATQNYIDWREATKQDDKYIYSPLNFIGQHAEYEGYLQPKAIIQPKEKPFWKDGKSFSS